jgi:hypothetical protein
MIGSMSRRIRSTGADECGARQAEMGCRYVALDVGGAVAVPRRLRQAGLRRGIGRLGGGRQRGLKRIPVLICILKMGNHNLEIQNGSYN